MTHLTPEIRKELLEFLKENLSLEVNESTETVDRSYGEYCDKTIFTIKLKIGNEVINEETISHYS